MKHKLEMTQVLLVEDDESDIFTMQRSFEKFGIQFPLLVARNGLEALNKLLGTEGELKLDPLPKFIILDINMPKMNGIEFLTELRKNENFNSILVFIYTTSSNERDVSALYHLHIAGYFLKQVKFSDSLKTLEVLNNYWLQLKLPSKVTSIISET